jgi:hypothetical protein
VWAWLEGANFWWARLEGAKLRQAQLEGADLTEARFDEKTEFAEAVFQYAAVKSCDLSRSSVKQDQVSTMFGDGSVTLPDGIKRPAHWPPGKIDWPDFGSEWRKWQASPETYAPPYAAP